jgi:hypothetical protein
MSGLQQIIAINAWAASRECAALQDKAKDAKDEQRRAEADAWQVRENLGLGQHEVNQAKPR